MVSKASFRTLTPALLLLLLTAPAYGGGYEWGGLGARATAMGGAFIGLADDWTANYWNPAGLAQLEGAEGGLELFSPHPTLRAGNSYANLPPSPQTSEIYKYTKDMFIDYTATFTGGGVSEPSQFNKTSTSFNFYNPNGVGGYVTIPEYFTLGAAVYSPLGYYTKWVDVMDFGMGEIAAKNHQRLIIVETQLTIAREVLPGLFAGAGAALLYDRIDRNSDKDVTDTGIVDYAYEFDLKADGYGAEGLFGLLYRINDRLSVGAVYRTGATVKLEGPVSSSVDIMGIYEDTRINQKFRHPPTWGVGLAFKPLLEKLTLTADWQRSDWSVFRTDVSFDQPGLLLQDQAYDEDWKDSNRYRLGCEFMVNPGWALRGGFMYDESPMPGKSISLAYIPDVDRKNVTLGTGFALGERVKLDVLGAYSWGNRHARGAKFEQRIWAGSLGATYTF